MNLLLILGSVSLTGIAQICFKLGMNNFRFTNIKDSIYFVIFSPYLVSGLLLMGFGMIIWLFVLSKNDVSYAYPFVSIAFLIVFIGGYFMGESLSISRLIGFLFLIVGMFFVAR